MNASTGKATRAAWVVLAGLSLQTLALAQPGKGPAPIPAGKPATGAQPTQGTKGGPQTTPGALVGPQPGTPKPTTLAPADHVPEAPDNSNPDELVNLPAFAEPVQLSTLIELVARTLNINITTQGEVNGTVVFNAPVPVKKSELIPLLDALLDQQGYMITRDKFGLYTVQQANAAIQAKPVGDDLTTTRIFKTPNMRPTALKQAIEGQLGPAPASPTGGRQTAYIDELGVIVATDTPRRLAVIADILQKLAEEASKSTFTRLELRYLAAPVARDRALQLVGQTSQPRPNTGNPNQPQAASPNSGVLDNLGDRLTVDATGNALIFRGVLQEIAQVQTVLSVIDVPNTLEPKNYAAGSAASQIANIARQRGLGEVTTITDLSGGGFDSGAVRPSNNAATLAAQTNQLTGGPVMVVNESTGDIIYYGTKAQHAELAALVKSLDTQADKIIIGVYKLKNSDAEDVAGIIQGLIQNTTPVGNSPLLGNNQNRPGTRNPTTPNNPNRPNPATQRTGNDLSLDGGGFVIADVANNQILVKAPTGQQPEFARLIERLDLRRPQVYIEAKIVAVNWSNDLRLAFETQLINGSTGGLLNTSFGLSSFATDALITAPKTVSTSLGGLTGAVVKSDMVPIIVNALQTKANARVLSVPQILVNDNEEAEISSVDTQPTSVTSQTSGNPSVTSAGPDEEAGTKLKVKPSISEGGYLRLKYNIELSSFTGSQISNASGTLPSPKQVNTIGSDAVTVPTDTTVIVGGLEFDSRRLTRAQVPLLGEIPLIGLLFQDRNSNDRTTTLYIFLTPKILRDPTFADLRLITAGPQSHMKLDADIPTLTTASIDINRSPAPAMQAIDAFGAPMRSPAPTPAQSPAPENAMISTTPGVVRRSQPGTTPGPSPTPPPPTPTPAQAQAPAPAQATSPTPAPAPAQAPAPAPTPAPKPESPAPAQGVVHPTPAPAPPPAIPLPTKPETPPAQPTPANPDQPGPSNDDD